MSCISLIPRPRRKTLTAEVKLCAPYRVLPAGAPVSQEKQGPGSRVPEGGSWKQLPRPGGRAPWACQQEQETNGKKHKHWQDVCPAPSSCPVAFLAHAAKVLVPPDWDQRSIHPNGRSVAEAKLKKSPFRQIWFHIPNTNPAGQYWKLHFSFGTRDYFPRRHLQHSTLAA